jgi:acetoin utilization protein AcuC
LSNAALWSAAVEIAALAPAAVVLGGGGYNPWTVARYWAGLWGALSGRKPPAILPPAAREVFQGLECDLIDAEDVSPLWVTTLADALSEAPVRREIEALRDDALRYADPRCWSTASRSPCSVDRDERRGCA